MLAEFPSRVSKYLARGGVDWPSIPPRAGTIASNPTPMPAQAVSVQSAREQPSGFALAVVIMALMVAVWIYALVAFAMGKTLVLPAWSERLIPILLIIGIGIAAYLSYVETQSVDAVCGPVGDCNAVQRSPYATLFGILPVGVLGILGYFAMFAAWLALLAIPKLAKPASILYFGMASLAVLFSIYLTYLEPFVIKAVCLWCLSSSVVVTLLLLLGTPRAVRHFSVSGEEVDAKS